MSKTDLEIIEIVKDYMNKELVEGCYIRHKSDSSIDKILGAYKRHHLQYIEVRIGRSIKPFILRDTHFEVLGTLDTTAIEKYIQEKGFPRLSDYDCGWIYYENYIINSYKKGDKEVIKYYKIPNKPYTTYTQEEKESLLEILKSLK